jgi:excisionase family DNA binding protein
MGEMFYSTGQAARELGITQARARLLCQNGQITAKITDGGQFRIPKSEVDRIKRDGLPATPRPMPNSPAGEPVPRSHRSYHSLTDTRAKPSGHAAEAAEQVSLLEKEVQAIGLRRQKEEALDWFREREEREAAQMVAYFTEKRKQSEAAEAERRRERWENRWHRYALEVLPSEVASSVKLEVPSLVREALQKTNPTQPDSLTRRLVDAAVERVLNPWRRRKEVEEIIEKAADHLPFSARSWPKPTEWQIRAQQAARRAVEELSENATSREIEQATRLAVEAVGRQFEFQELRTKIVNTVSTVLRGETSNEREEAKEAVAHGLAAVQLGTSQRELERIRDVVLAQIQKRINDRIGHEHEHRRREQDRYMREQLLRWPDLSFPYDFSEESKKQGLVAAQAAINTLPYGAQEPALRRARDEAVAPILKAHEQWKKKGALIDLAMQELCPYLLKLSNEWDFKESLQTLQSKLNQPIRKQLENMLSGNELTEQAKSYVRSLVRQELDI